jgi:hypothetical protein
MMRRMDDALLSGLVGAIVGAVIGAVATAGGAWLVAGRQIAAGERARELEALRGIVGDFLAAVDRLWRAQQSLGYAVFEMVASRGEPEARAHADDRRQEAFAELRPARHEADHALGLLRILYPNLAASAAELADASAQFTVGAAGEGKKQTEDYRDERQAALDAFEKEARHALTRDRG